MKTIAKNEQASNEGPITNLAPLGFVIIDGKLIPESDPYSCNAARQRSDVDELYPDEERYLAKSERDDRAYSRCQGKFAVIEMNKKEEATRSRAEAEGDRVFSFFSAAQAGELKPLDVPSPPLSIAARVRMTAPTPSSNAAKDAAQQIYEFANAQNPFPSAESKAQAENEINKTCQKDPQSIPKYSEEERRKLVAEYHELAKELKKGIWDPVEQEYAISRQNKIARWIPEVSQHPRPSAESKARAENKINKTYQKDPQPSSNKQLDESDRFSCHVPYRRSDAHEFYPKTENHLKEWERDGLARQRCLQKTIDIANKKKEEAQSAPLSIGGQALMMAPIPSSASKDIAQQINISADTRIPFPSVELKQSSESANVKSSKKKISVLEAPVGLIDTVVNSIPWSQIAKDLHFAGQPAVPPTAEDRRIAKTISNVPALKNIVTSGSVAADIYATANTYIPTSSVELKKSSEITSIAPPTSGSKIGIVVEKRKTTPTSTTGIIDAVMNFIFPKAKAGELHRNDIPRRTFNMPANATSALSKEARINLIAEYDRLGNALDEGIWEQQEEADAILRRGQITLLIPEIQQKSASVTTYQSPPMTSHADSSDMEPERDYNKDPITMYEAEAAFYAKQSVYSSDEQLSSNVLTTQPTEEVLPSKEVTQLLKMQMVSPAEMKSILENSSLMDVMKQLAQNEEKRELLQKQLYAKQEWNEILDGGKTLFGLLEQQALKVGCKPLAIAGKLGGLTMMACIGLEKLGYFSGVAAVSAASSGAAGATAVTAASGAAAGAGGGMITFGAALGAAGLLLTAAFMGMELLLGNDDADEMGNAIINVFNQHFTVLRAELHEIYSKLAGGISQVIGMLRHVQQNQDLIFKQQIATYELIGQCFKMMQVSLHNSNSETRHRLERIEINIQYLIKLTEQQELKTYRAKIKKTVNKIRALNSLANSDAKTIEMIKLMANLDSARQEMCEKDWNGVRAFKDHIGTPLQASEFLTRRINGGDYSLGYLAKKFEMATGLQLSNFNVNKKQLFANNIWHLASSHYVQLLSLLSLQEHSSAHTLNSIEEQSNNAIRFMNVIGSSDVLFTTLLGEHERILHEVQFRICQYYTLSKTTKGKSDDYAPGVAMFISHYISGEYLNSLNEILSRLDANYLLLNLFARVGGLSDARRKIIKELTNGDAILNQKFYPHEFSPKKTALHDSVASLQTQVNDKNSDELDIKQLNLNLFDTGLNIIGAHKVTNYNWRELKGTEPIIHLNISACIERWQSYRPCSFKVHFIPMDDKVNVSNQHPSMPLDFHKLGIWEGCSEFSGIWASSHIHITDDLSHNKFFILYTGSSGQVAMRALNDVSDPTISEENRWLDFDSTHGPKHPTIKVNFFVQDCLNRIRVNCFKKDKLGWKEKVTPVLSHEPIYSSQTLKTRGHLIVMDSDWSDAERVTTRYYFVNLKNRTYVQLENAEDIDCISKAWANSPNHVFSAISVQPEYSYENFDMQVHHEGVIIHGAVKAGQKMQVTMNQHLYKENNLPTKDMTSFKYYSAEKDKNVGIVDTYPIPSQSISQVMMTHMFVDGRSGFILTVSYKVSDTDSRLACIVYPDRKFSKTHTGKRDTQSKECIFELPHNVHPIPDCQAMRTVVVHLGGKDYLMITLFSKTYTLLIFLFDPRTLKVVQLADGPTIHVPSDDEFDFFEELRKEYEGFFPWNNFALNVKYEDGMAVAYFSFTRIENAKGQHAVHNDWKNHVYEVSYKIGPSLKATFQILAPKHACYENAAWWKPLVPTITQLPDSNTNKIEDANATVLLQTPNNDLSTLLLQLNVVIALQREKLKKSKAITTSAANDSEQNGNTSSVAFVMPKYNQHASPAFLPSKGLIPHKFTAVKQANAFTERSKSTHLYTASDVDYVLQQYKKMEIFKDVEIVDVISNVGDSTPAKRLSQVAESNKTIFGIFNVKNLHWTTFCILRTKENKMLMLYKDSKYGNEPPAALVESVASIFDGIQIQYYLSKEQTDGTSCGIFALENLRRLAIALQDPEQDKGFCTQEDAHELRGKEFAEKVVLGAYETVKDCEAYKLFKDAVKNHHHSEAAQIVKILQESEQDKKNKGAVMLLDEKYKHGLPSDGKMGVSIFVPRKLPDDLNKYRYQYQLCFNSLEPEEINARLLKAFGLEEDSYELRQTKLGFYELILDPVELSTVTKCLPMTTFSMPTDSDLEKATYASLGVSNKEEQDRVQSILKEYLKPVVKCKV